MDVFVEDLFMSRCFVSKRETAIDYDLARELRLSVCFNAFLNLKMAEHSFQVPMPNSPFLLNYLCLAPVFLQESRLTTGVLILTF